MSINVIEGAVSYVGSNEIDDKYNGGKVTLHSFRIEGNDEWFRTGRTPPGVQEGQTVKFIADGNKVEVKSIEILGNTTEAPASGETPSAVPSQTTSASSAVLASGKAATKDNYWSDREKREIEKDERYQTVDIPRMTMNSALSTAATVVDAALKHEAIGFGNTAKSKRLEMLGDFVVELANQFYPVIRDAGTVTPEGASDKVYPEEGE